MTNRVGGTGLRLDFTDLVLSAAGSHILIALLLTMVAGIVLGMGMPTAPAYIMHTALLVPALVKLGVIVEAAHMFVLYFAILSAITPPVALAVYAANGISRAGLFGSPALPRCAWAHAASSSSSCSCSVRRC